VVPASTSQQAAQTASDGSANAGVIAGSVIGAVVVCAIVVAVVVRSRRGRADGTVTSEVSNLSESREADSASGDKSGLLVRRMSSAESPVPEDFAKLQHPLGDLSDGSSCVTEVQPPRLWSSVRDGSMHSLSGRSGVRRASLSSTGGSRASIRRESAAGVVGPHSSAEAALVLGLASSSGSGSRPQSKSRDVIDASFFDADTRKESDL
jgi:hypothetical protein